MQSIQDAIDVTTDASEKKMLTDGLADLEAELKEAEKKPVGRAQGHARTLFDPGGVAQEGARVCNLPRASDRLVDITPGGQDKQKQSGGRGGPAR
jgi:hypothetical protein